MIYPGDPLGPEGREAAQKALAAGLAVALPTDTVYVLAVDPFVPGAADRLFAMVERPREQDLPVLVASVWQALKLATAVPTASRRLMESCWPGPLTLVLPRDPEVAADLGDDDLTVGIRMPDHPVPLLLARDVGPLAVATLSALGEPEFETAAELVEEFGDEVPVVLDGGRCAGPAATVVDGTGEDPLLIREGRLPWATILGAIGRSGERSGGGRSAARPSRAPEPGDAAARLAASSSRKTSSRWTVIDRGASIPMRTWSPRTSRTVTTTSEPIMMLWLARRVRTSTGAPSVELG